jgi:hypothetical protein
MSDVLVRITRAVLAGRHAFSEKARMEMETDGLTESDVMVYSKGKLVTEGGEDRFYFLVSSKRAL